MPDSDGLLNSIKCIEDFRKLPEDRLAALAQEIRERITEVVSKNGGHLASNLGVVELTLALHRVFNFTKDNIVFDVGHQCYVHKLLTGRNDKFDTLRTRNGLTGFPNPAESDLDMFVSGHAATSISAALGLAMGSRMRGEPNTAVAVIGDGSIGGGLAFEALNHAGQSGEDIVVVLNDNDMAIAETVGALSGYLSRLRTDPLYNRLREDLKGILKKIPLIGGQLDWLHESIIDGVKQIIEPGHIFTELGFKYYGPLDGHDLGLLTEEFRNIAMLKGPRLVHVNTSKGKGFGAAESDPESFHSASPFEVNSCGQVECKCKSGKSYTAVLSDALLSACERDKRIVAITAAMPAGTGLNKISEKYPERYIDVGISEEHAVTLSGGLAKAGMKPVVVIYSTFLQRAYDQIFHDICLQKNLPVIFALDRAGIVGADGPTHHGVFDIAMLRNLPGITIMAPRDGNELQEMLNFALLQNGPCAIRYPRCTAGENGPASNAPLQAGKAEILRDGDDAVIFAFGEVTLPSYHAAEKLAESGISAAVVNLRFAKPIDHDTVLKYAKKCPAVFTVEDGCIMGGAGSAVGEAILDAGIKPKLFKSLGIPDRFIEHATRDELMRDLGLDAEGICNTVAGMMKSVQVSEISS